MYRDIQCLFSRWCKKICVFGKKGVFFDLDGSVEQVEFEIYFDKSSDRIDQEIEYIFTSLNDGITEQQIEKFIQDTQLVSNS